MITPIQGRLLIELKGRYEHLPSTTKEQFGDSKTRGRLLAMAGDVTKADLTKIGAVDLKVGDMVYFGKFEDTAPYGDNEDLVLIKLEDIGGFERA